MRISTLTIENFGCIEYAQINFNGYTALIGPNNSGKSTILSAIDTFFSTAPKIEAKHFFRYEEDRTITIAIEFSDLTPVEQEEYGTAVIENHLRVTRHFGGEFERTGIYSVEAMAFPAFQNFREETNGTNRRSLYATLRPEYGLPVAAGPAMEQALVIWEAEHPDQLQRVRTRGFFGASNVASGKLRKKTSVRLIPAVADIGSQTDNPKTSPVIQLIGDIRQQTLENKAEFLALVETANRSIFDYIEGVDTNSVNSIGEEITSLLNRYYSDTHVAAELPPPNEIAVSFPPPKLRVKHRAISSGVESVGHGLQRAILFSVVQFLAQHTAIANDNAPAAEFNEAASDIIILIEEPEIYQHPQKQRIIQSVLENISSKFNKTTGIRIQVIICTHSEKFVKIQNVDALRIVRTIYEDDRYQTTVTSLKLETLRDLIFQARGGEGQPMEINTFAAGLHVFSESVSEGFFAEKIVLVEGVDDAAVIDGTLRARNCDPQAEGIAIIPVDGKTKLDKPLQSFLHFGIKTFCVFDNDRRANGQRTDYNHLIQAICSEANPIDFPIGVKSNYAAVDGNLENYLREVTGDRYDEIRNQVAESYGVSPSDMPKSPATASAFLIIARGMGIEFELLDSIANKIKAL